MVVGQGTHPAQVAGAPCRGLPSTQLARRHAPLDSARLATGPIHAIANDSEFGRLVAVCTRGLDDRPGGEPAEGREGPILGDSHSLEARLADPSNDRLRVGLWTSCEAIGGARPSTPFYAPNTGPESRRLNRGHRQLGRRRWDDPQSRSTEVPRLLEIDTLGTRRGSVARVMRRAPELPPPLRSRSMMRDDSRFRLFILHARIDDEFVWISQQHRQG